MNVDHSQNNYKLICMDVHDGLKFLLVRLTDEQSMQRV